jgi:hypothetical protein
LSMEQCANFWAFVSSKTPIFHERPLSLLLVNTHNTSFLGILEFGLTRRGVGIHGS